MWKTWWFNWKHISGKHGCVSRAAAPAPDSFLHADLHSTRRFATFFFFLFDSRRFWPKSAEIGRNPSKLAEKLAETAPIQSDSVRIRRGRRKIYYQKICEEKKKKGRRRRNICNQMICEEKKKKKEDDNDVETDDCRLSNRALECDINKAMHVSSGGTWQWSFLEASLFINIPTH